MKKKIIILISCIVLLIICVIATKFLHRKHDLTSYPNKIDFNNQQIFVNDYITKTNNIIEQYNMIIPESFEKVAENNYLELYLEKETIAIAIKVKSNGYIWYSYDVEADYSDYSSSMINQIRSGISIYTYNKYTPGKRTVLDENVKLTYKLIDQGFKVIVDFTEIMIKLTLYVKLDDEDLLIEIPYETIEEYNPKLWTAGNTDISLHKISLYPFLGSTKIQNDGYIIIPDGTGAIISLKDEPKFKLNYSQPVYGKDYGYEDNPLLAQEDPDVLKVDTVKPLSRITMPLFGIIHETGNNGILVVSESGASYAHYNFISKGLTTDFYQSYFDYYYRVAYKQYQSRSDETMHILGFQHEPNNFDLRQRIIFLEKDEANYVGAAKAYRNYLEKNNVLSSKIETKESYPTKIDIIGNEIEQGLFKHKDVTTSKYIDTINLIDKLKSDGFNKLDVTFKTFDRNTYAYRFNVFKNLGSKEDLRKMINYFSNDDDIYFNYYVDYTNTFKQNRTSASRMSRTILSRYNYSYMFYIQYINNPRYFLNMIKEDLNTYKLYNINSLSISGFDNALFTHNDNKVIRYRNDNIQYIISAIKKLKDEGILTSFYNPDAYLYSFVMKYYDTPISSSEQMFIDATIPFLQLVISGYMELYSPYLNFYANDIMVLLRLIEYGVNPSYVMTTENVYNLKYTNSSYINVSQYESLKNRMCNYNDFLKKGLDAINGSELVNHIFIAEGVSKSEFANGTVIIVNYTNSDYNYNGVTIKAKGYDVL